MPYNPKSQGAVESFNKTIQKFLESAKYHKKEKFDLEDSVNDFLCYYNNKKHSTTQTSPYEEMKNMDDKQLILKVALATEKSRNKAKKISENFEIGELVRISNHTKVLKNSNYVVYNPPQGLRKGIIKERWEVKARVLKNRMNYCKVQIIESISQNQDFIENDIWNVAKQVLKKSN